MPLSEEEFADKDDNELFRKIKLKNWDQVEALLTMIHTAGGVPAISSKQVEERRQIPLFIGERDKFGNTPLHAALGYEAPERIVLKLIELNPQACRVHGTDDWLPLHVAAMWGASTNTVEALIRKYPQALDDHASGDIKGRTPRYFSSRFPHNKDLFERTTSDWIDLIERDTMSSSASYLLENIVSRRHFVMKLLDETVDGRRSTV